MPGSALAISSRAIEFDRLDLAVVTMHIQSDRAATNFAILNGRKSSRGSIDDRGEDRSAVGANNL